jgi:hypothetical protein
MVRSGGQPAYGGARRRSRPGRQGGPRGPLRAGDGSTRRWGWRCGGFAYAIPALAGSMAAKRKAAASVGTFPTDGPLFVGLLPGVIVILYLLQYFPALALGPAVEHFHMPSGKTL